MSRNEAFSAFLIGAAILLGTFLHYGDHLPALQGITDRAPVAFYEHTLHLPFAALPIAYAAWVFGLPAGLVTLVVSMALLGLHLPFDQDAQERTLLGLHLISLSVSSFIMVIAVAKWGQERRARDRHSAQLEASELKYRALVEHNSEAIFLVNSRGDYLEVNPRACELTGYSHQELLSMNVRHLVPPGDTPRGLAQALSAGGARREAAFRKKDGSQFLGEINITSFNLEGQRVALGALRDISETRRLQAEVQAQADALRDGYRLHIRSLGLALDARNPYTRGHGQRVREYAVAVAQRLGLTEERVQMLSLAAELHDYGKIGIADAILLKAGPLSPPEWAEIRRHPGLTVALIEHIPFLSATLPIIRAHHEKLDGSGYPDGLRGDGIPFESRIIGVVDAYDALTSARSYRTALSHSEAWMILRRETGAKWDPVVVDAFREVTDAWMAPPGEETVRGRIYRHD